MSTTPQVQYTFADGSANTVRPTGIIYPNGREVSYDYGTSDGIDDRASRIASIIDDDDTHLADYRYLGRQTFVEQDDTEPQMKWTLIDLAGSNDLDTGDIYTGFDRFGRVKDNRWYNYDADEDVDRIQYGHDRASNRIWRKNVVAAALGKQFDELYTYDGVHRLKDMVRGTLNGGHTALTSETFAESWALDSTGNWRGFKQDDNGNGTWDLIQSRTANPVNEITGIAESVGPSWVTPAYNRAGNMTTMPQPADPTASYTATYDAWNRLVKIADGGDTVSEYAYDGAKRRIVQKSYDGGILDETRHLYYTEPAMWQAIEERVGTSSDNADAERQFVWGLRYIDNLVVRDRDTDANGSLDGRLYAAQDANWNVTSIADTAEEVQERYAYSAYGLPAFLTLTFTASGASSFDWETLYCGYHYEAPTQLFHVRNRSNQSRLGSWIQRDPLKHAGFTNLHEYVNSSPTNKLDPSGTVAIVCGCTNDGDGQWQVKVDCKGLGSKCCQDACEKCGQPGGLLGAGCRWDGSWDIVSGYVPPEPWPGYGKYCGPRCNEPEKPIDCIDAACRVHDRCMGTVLDWANPFTKMDCEMSFCAAILSCNCDTSPDPYTCRTAKFYILLYACPKGVSPLPFY